MSQQDETGAARPGLCLFFDDDCELCRRLAWVVRHWDRGRKVEVVPLSRPDLSAVFPALDVGRARRQLTAVDGQGRVYEGLAAVRQVAQRLPAVRRLGWIYQVPGVGRVADGLYRTTNHYRRRLCLRCGEHWTPSRSRRLGPRGEGRA